MNKTLSQIKDQLKDKNIGILGFGREGQSSFRLLKKLFPDKNIGILDQNNQIKIKGKSVNTHLGKEYLLALKQYDVVFRSPGISHHKIKKHLNQNTELTSQTKLFFKHCPSQIIGVTGTKGKSTTASLIYSVLKQKYSSFLVGNIGLPPLDCLAILKPTDKVAFELSSHQLADLTQSPSIAILLNLFPEHLDYYQDFDQYCQAKTNIFKHQSSSDLLIYNSDDKNILHLIKSAKSKKTSYSQNSQNLKVKHTNLIGEFNQMNVMPAVIIGRHFDISNDKIIKAIRLFKPLPNRLEVIGQYQGITFINDSLATTPPATIRAISSLKEKLGCLIVGGFDRNIDQAHLVTNIISQKVPSVIVFPDTGKQIKKALIKAKFKGQILSASNMLKAVQLAYQNTSSGKICLMSPAAASFNMFRDYKDRGEQFKKAVKSLK